MNTRIVAAAVVVTGGLLAGQAVAAEQGGYVGFAIGQSKAKIDQGDIDSAFASLGLGASTSVDDTDIGFKVYGGYRFNRNFAIEGGYTDFGKFTSHSVVTSGGSGTGDGEWKAYSIDLSALGILPLNERFSLFGRAGLSLWNMDFTFTAAGPGGVGIASESRTGFSPLLGIGATFNFTRQLALRAEFERHFSVGDSDTTGKSDIDLISLGLQVRF
jgi:OOP family OmpA-OmpF porin